MGYDTERLLESAYNECDSDTQAALQKVIEVIADLNGKRFKKRDYASGYELESKGE